MPATSQDAQIILQLYDLRREAVMRKARSYIGGEFWPTKAEDVLNLLQNFGAEENAYLRQVLGYWEMATALANHGSVNLALFADCANEAVFVFAKFHPFLAQIREAHSPEFLRQTEQYIESSATATKQLERMLPRIAEWTKMNRSKKTKEAAAD